MNRDRVIILVGVFVTSQCAAYLSTKIINCLHQFLLLLKLLFTNNCTGTEKSIMHIKRFSSSAIIIIKHVFYFIGCKQIFLSQICNFLVNCCTVLEDLNNIFWNGMTCLNSEIHHSLCHVLVTGITTFWTEILSYMYSFLDYLYLRNLSPNIGIIALMFAAILLCFLIYFTFVIFIIIVKLYKLFLKPLIKMLTSLLNYRRRFVLRSRRL